MTAWMDGTNSVEIVSGLSGPRGIAVDCESSRLFWTDIFEGSVKSNGLDGSNVTVLVEEGSVFRISVERSRIYFGTSSYGGLSELKSCAKMGGDVKTLYTGSITMQHIASISPALPLTARKNHCEGKVSPADGICVLTPSSSIPT